MQFSKTSILGLVVIMVTQATSRPVELNSQVQAEATPWTTLTCTYSYNALYDWYVIKGEGFNFRENNANREIKKCAEKAGAFTGWLQRNTADTDGAIDVQFRLELGPPRGKLQRCLEERLFDDGRKVKCQEVSRESQHIISNIFGPDK